MSPRVAAAVVDALRWAAPGAVECDAPLGALTTWRVGGPAAVRVTVADPEVLARVATAIPDDTEVLVLGRGSNLLVADAGFPGVALVLGEGFETVDVADDGVVTAGGAVALPVLARRAAAAGRAGLGFFVGIPGSVGGAVRMNAGGHGRETADVLVDAAVATIGTTAGVETWDPARLALGYRHSALGPRDVVTAARFSTDPGDATVLKAEMAEIVRWRTDHQPGGANAGSVFRNPPGDAAARLIDVECGLRGTALGGATVSEKHANFIQAGPGATAADVRALIELVRERVEAVTGVRLEPEVHAVGFE